MNAIDSVLFCNGRKCKVVDDIPRASDIYYLKISIFSSEMKLLKRFSTSLVLFKIMDQFM